MLQAKQIRGEEAVEFLRVPQAASGILQRRKRHGAEAPFLVPGDGEEIVEAASAPVPDAVFGDSSNARRVLDGDFQSGGPVAMHQHGKKTVEAVEGEKPLQCGTLEGANGAAGGSKVHLENAPARTSGDS